MYTPITPKRTWRTWAAWFVGFLVLTTAGRMYGDYADKRDAASQAAKLHGEPAPHTATRAQSSAFETRLLQGGVSIALPRDWRWMGAADASSLNTGSEALADAVGLEANQGNNTVLIAGNAFNDERQSVATMRVSVRSSAMMSQADLREGLKEPKVSTEAAIMEGTEATAAAMRKLSGMVYFKATGASLSQNASLICIKTSFEYDQGQGPMISDTWVCPLSSRTVKLSTSYQKSRESQFAPTIDYMWRSLSVTG